jgi:hypothetical protein
MDKFPIVHELIILTIITTQKLGYSLIFMSRLILCSVVFSDLAPDCASNFGWQLGITAYYYLSYFSVNKPRTAQGTTSLHQAVSKDTRYAHLLEYI